MRLDNQEMEMKLSKQALELIRAFGAPHGCTYPRCDGCESWKCATRRDLEAIRQDGMTIRERLQDDLECLKTSRDRLLADIEYDHKKAYVRLSDKKYEKKIDAVWAQYEEKVQRLRKRADAEERLSDPQPFEFRVFTN